jgi:hypothetical protein
MKIASQVIGALWIVQGLALAIEEIMRAMRGEQGISLVVALVLYAIVVAVGAYILARAKGWTIVGTFAALYQGGSHFIGLSNVWPQLDYSAWFSLFVVCLSVATIVVAVVHWTKKPPEIATSAR